MPHLALAVRHARVEDVDDLLRLWSRTVPDAVAETSPESAAVALQRIEANPDEVLLVAESDEVLCASLRLQVAQVSPVDPAETLHTSYLLVDPDFRGHGAGRTMLEAAVEYAEERGIEHVSAIAGSGSRDMNRFLARVGLGSVAVFRRTKTVSLRVKLTGDRSVRRNAGDRQLVQELVHRRSVRRRRNPGTASTTPV